MSTSLDYLKASGTVVVSDSGDFECMFSFNFRVQTPGFGIDLDLVHQRSMSISPKMPPPTQYAKLFYISSFCLIKTHSR